MAGDAHEADVTVAVGREHLRDCEDRSGFVRGDETSLFYRGVRLDNMVASGSNSIRSYQIATGQIHLPLIGGGGGESPSYSEVCLAGQIAYFTTRQSDCVRRWKQRLAVGSAELHLDGGEPHGIAGSKELLGRVANCIVQFDLLAASPVNDDIWRLSCRLKTKRDGRKHEQKSAKG